MSVATQECVAFFQGLMKSSLVPVLPMEWASLSLNPPLLLFFFLSLPLYPPHPTTSYPLLSLTLIITKHRGSDEQVALRAAVYKTRCASMCVCVCVFEYMCVSMCVFECLRTCACSAFCSHRLAMMSLNNVACAWLSHRCMLES